MTQYNTLNVKLPHSQINNLKSEIKNGNDLTLEISSNIVGDSNDENNFPYKLLLTNTRSFVKLSQIIPQLIWNYQKLDCIK